MAFFDIITETREFFKGQGRFSRRRIAFGIRKATAIAVKLRGGGFMNQLRADGARQKNASRHSSRGSRHKCRFAHRLEETACPSHKKSHRDCGGFSYVIPL